MRHTNSNRYQGFFLLVLIICTAVSFIQPRFARDQLLQHLPTAAVVIALMVSMRHQLLSNLSFTMIILFMMMHVVGARYIYSFVPYDEWSSSIFGASVTETFSFRRNHYDRLVHLCYGLLMTYPFHELVIKQITPKRIWSGIIAALIIMASSLVYEVGEWLVAIIFAPDWADRYLGQQGDPWDAQKDMALATLGAVITILFLLVIRRRSLMLSSTVTNR